MRNAQLLLTTNKYFTAINTFWSKSISMWRFLKGHFRENKFSRNLIREILRNSRNFAKIKPREIYWKSKIREIRENLFPRKFGPLRYDRKVVELNHSGVFQTEKFQRIAKFAKFCAREIWRKSEIREIRKNKFSRNISKRQSRK